jgi:hypothetical protein
VHANDLFLEKQPEPLKGCFLAMRAFMLNSHDDIKETTKYGMPCFTFRGKPFCYLWKDKKSNEPYFLWVDGKLMNHPALEQGTRNKMKILRVNPTENLPIELIKTVMKEALNLRA